MCEIPLLGDPGNTRGELDAANPSSGAGGLGATKHPRLRPATGSHLPRCSSTPPFLLMPLWSSGHLSGVAFRMRQRWYPGRTANMKVTRKAVKANE